MKCIVKFRNPECYLIDSACFWAMPNRSTAKVFTSVEEAKEGIKNAGIPKEVQHIVNTAEIIILED
jgi:hypothetical protein